MGNYRPITDTWILARTKLKFYGAYPSGFLGRARALLCREDEPLLHVCGGRVKDYPFPGLGKLDRTIDLDPATEPDFLLDVREMGHGEGDRLPCVVDGEPIITDPLSTKEAASTDTALLWPAALIDRPYTREDAEHYGPGAEGFPENLNDLLRRTLAIVRPGGRVGVLDYLWPQPPKVGVRLIACIGVIVGFNNRLRCFSVYQREMPAWRKLTGARSKAEPSAEKASVAAASMD